MESVKLFFDEWIVRMGVSEMALPYVSHVVMMIVAVLLAWLSYWLSCTFLVPLVIKITKRTAVEWDDVLLNERVLLSACQIVPAVVIWMLLPLSFFDFPVVREILARITAIYITAMTVRTCIEFIDSIREMDSDTRSSKQQYLYIFIGAIKILMIFIAAIVVVGIVIDKNPMSLLAGLGATSAILMLVFKDTIEGLVAGIRLTSNDMMHKGDWITVPGTEISGIVEEMSLTTVKIRNFDNTMMTISPLTLVNGTFQNWKSMEDGGRRRVKRMVFFDVNCVRFADGKRSVTNMAQFRKAMETYLRSREEVAQDATIIVKQLEATPTGLPVEFVFFLKYSTSVDYEHTLAEIMEYVYAISSEFGLVLYQRDSLKNN